MTFRVTRRTALARVFRLLAGFGLAAVFSVPRSRAKAKDMRPIRCPESECGHLYDPAVGEPSQGIPPGVAFEDLPDDWECPECATPKYLW